MSLNDELSAFGEAGRRCWFPQTTNWTSESELSEGPDKDPNKRRVKVSPRGFSASDVDSRVTVPHLLT